MLDYGIEFKGIKLDNLGTLVDCIAACETVEDAIEFFTMYSDKEPFARASVRYATGYLEPESKRNLASRLFTEAMTQMGYRSKTRENSVPCRICRRNTWYDDQICESSKCVAKNDSLRQL
jgi:hypothetical protein